MKLNGSGKSVEVSRPVGKRVQSISSISRAANLAGGRDEMCPQRYIFQHASGHMTIPRARLHDVLGSSCHRKDLSRVMEHQVCTYSSYELSLLLYRPMEPGVGYGNR